MSSTRLPAEIAERLLAGEPGAQAVAGLLAAATRPGTLRELTGEAAARRAFVTGRACTGQQVPGRHRLRAVRALLTAKIVGVAALTLTAGGVAVAATDPSGGEAPTVTDEAPAATAPEPTTATQAPATSRHSAPAPDAAPAAADECATGASIAGLADGHNPCAGPQPRALTSHSGRFAGSGRIPGFDRTTGSGPGAGIDRTSRSTPGAGPATHGAGPADVTTAAPRPSSEPAARPAPPSPTPDAGAPGPTAARPAVTGPTVAGPRTGQAAPSGAPGDHRGDTGPAGGSEPVSGAHEHPDPGPAPAGSATDHEPGTPGGGR